MENALEKLKLLTAWETEPALTEIEVEDLLNAASIADENGNEPANDSWVPTFDLNKAAADGWLIKAARASAMTEIEPPESGIVTSQVFDNCRKMAAIYAAKCRLTVRI
ncbi:MAG: hypothetical protein KF855_13285 [Acidobacteria bacterium]|nr:hypothetical protein [Acidobacteriota bacterium]